MPLIVTAVCPVPFSHMYPVLVQLFVMTDMKPALAMERVPLNWTHVSLPDDDILFDAHRIQLELPTLIGLPESKKIGTAAADVCNVFPVINHTELAMRETGDNTSVKQLLVCATSEFALNTNLELPETEIGDEVISKSGPFDWETNVLFVITNELNDVTLTLHKLAFSVSDNEVPLENNKHPVIVNVLCMVSEKYERRVRALEPPFAVTFNPMSSSWLMFDTATPPTK